MPTVAVCSICGASPCYFICPNSPEYYSPEQEREDTLWSESFPYVDPSLRVEDYDDHEAYEAEMNAMHSSVSDAEWAAARVAEDAKWVSNQADGVECEVPF